MAFPPAPTSDQPPVDPLKPPAPPAPPAPAPTLGDTGGTPITLTMQQVQSAGLDGLNPGDKFSVMVTGTVTDASNGVTADINDVSMGEKMGDEPGGDLLATPDDANFEAPKGSIEMGPGKMKGFL